MSKFIQGDDRHQTTLFPERMDDFVPEDSPVRVIDVFIERLDISGFGFKAVPAATGRPGYHPRTLLKIYLYGYLNQIQSSRKLEREAGRNVELMWLTQRLAPDFKTIADFRKDNGEAIRLVCREFVMLCRKLDLLTDTLVAIDGSKFKAVNNRDKNFTRTKLKQQIEKVDAAIERYLAMMADVDAVTPNESGQPIKDKLASLQEEMDRLKKIEVRLLASPDKQLSITDPDARSMKGRGGGIVGYNVQTAVDAKHHLIVAHEVSNDGTDKRQLSNMAIQAKAVLEADQIDVVADRGYYSSMELKACDDHDITTYVPRPKTSNNRAKGQFNRTAFTYIAEDDEYECPAGERLIFRFGRHEAGRDIRRYWTSACPRCPIKSQCTTGSYRRLTRWVHEDILDDIEDRLEKSPDAMKVRRATVEHPFGTMKHWMGRDHFLTKKLPNVSTEMSLQVLAYNMTRAINILGTKRLLEAM